MIKRRARRRAAGDDVLPHVSGDGITAYLSMGERSNMRSGSPGTRRRRRRSCTTGRRRGLARRDRAHRDLNDRTWEQALPVFLRRAGWVTDARVRRLRGTCGKTLSAAAGAAGMSERTARWWQDGGVAVDGEGAEDVADAGGPVRRRVAVGGGAAVGGGYGGGACRPDAVPEL